MVKKADNKITFSVFHARNIAKACNFAVLLYEKEISTLNGKAYDEAVEYLKDLQRQARRAKILVQKCEGKDVDDAA